MNKTVVIFVCIHTGTLTTARLLPLMSHTCASLSFSSGRQIPNIPSRLLLHC